LHFTGIPTSADKRQRIQAQVDNYHFTNELTFCGWVKYAMQNEEKSSKSVQSNNSPFAILSYLSSTDSWLPIFWMSNSGVATSGNLLIENQLTGNQWYHVSPLK
jgi:hypothetical protein